jgi:hypothetical protein
MIEGKRHRHDEGKGKSNPRHVFFFAIRRNHTREDVTQLEKARGIPNV